MNSGVCGNLGGNLNKKLIFPSLMSGFCQERNHTWWRLSSSKLSQADGACRQMIGEGGYRGDPMPARPHKELSRVETKQGQPTIRQRQRQRQRQTLYVSIRG